MTTNTKSKEIVICSAVSFKDGTLIRGHRHSDCLRIGHEIGLDKVGNVQGFITSKNRFVDRKEGLKIQLEAGIKSAEPDGYHPSGELFSEDLY